MASPSLAGQYTCCREDFTHWFSNFHSYYMRRDESCLVANSTSEPKFSESNRCQKMVEIHGYNEHISVTGEDDNPCHATLSDSMNSVRNYSDVGLFMVDVKVWVLEHFGFSFWPSAANEVKLEQLVKGYLMDHFTAHPDDLLIVLSRIVGDETSTSTQSIMNGELFQHPRP